MTVNQYLMKTLKPFGLPVADGLYQGIAKEFFYFVIADDRGGDFGEDEALCDDVSVQVYYRCPYDSPYSGMKTRIRRALEEAGFTYPSVTDLSDSKERIRRLCFECEIDSGDIEEED